MLVGNSVTEQGELCDSIFRFTGHNIRHAILQGHARGSTDGFTPDC